MKRILLMAMSIMIAVPMISQTTEKNNLNFVKQDTPELGEVYSLGDTLFADANDFGKNRVILYNKADMEYRHNAIYGKNFNGQITEQFAIFPGNFKKWVSENIIYPKKAKKKRIQGVVSVSVLIDPNGRIAYTKLVNQPDELLVKETMRLISVMPTWTPAHFNERKGYESYILDFWFTLPDETVK